MYNPEKMEGAINNVNVSATLMKNHTNTEE
jgi:hypothetical protein